MDTEVLVVGAGPAGLAVAATLKGRGRRPLVIEKSTQVGARSGSGDLHFYNWAGPALARATGSKRETA